LQKEPGQEAGLPFDVEVIRPAVKPRDTLKQLARAYANWRYVFGGGTDSRTGGARPCRGSLARCGLAATAGMVGFDRAL